MAANADKTTIERTIVEINGVDVEVSVADGFGSRMIVESQWKVVDRRQREEERKKTAGGVLGRIRLKTTKAS